MTPEPIEASPECLFEYLMIEHGVKSMSQLAAELECDVAYLYKVRAGKLPMSANLILRIHEQYGMGVQEIRDRSGQKAKWSK